MNGNLLESDLQPLIEQLEQTKTELETRCQLGLGHAQDKERVLLILRRLGIEVERVIAAEWAIITADESLQASKEEQQALPEAFQVPSPELTLAMLDVTRDELAERGAEDVDALLEEMSADLRDELLGTIAQFALSALDRGEKALALSQGKKLESDFAAELMRNLPIDPYGAPRALNGLQTELLAAAKAGALSASWGRLTGRDGDIGLVLDQSAAHPEAMVAFAS